MNGTRGADPGKSEGVEHLKNTEAYVAPPPSAVDRS
jgi:hypothetical protein